MNRDESIAKAINAKFEQFESDGESDAEDLDQRFDNFCAQAREGQADDADFLMEMKNHIAMIIKKLQHKKKELMVGMKAEIHYQIGTKVNVVIQDLNMLKEIVRHDMKRWTAQRADMQL